jgi:transcriptional regulator with XRE-family HTH domain
VLLSLRIERNQTQEALAHAAGLTVTAYARIERGSANPTWTTVRRIASALEVTMGELGEAVDTHATRSRR